MKRLRAALARALEESLVFPAACAAMMAWFYALASLLGYSHDEILPFAPTFILGSAFLQAALFVPDLLGRLLKVRPRGTLGEIVAPPAYGFVFGCLAGDAFIHRALGEQHTTATLADIALFGLVLGLPWGILYLTTRRIVLKISRIHRIRA